MMRFDLLFCARASNQAPSFRPRPPRAERRNP